MSLTPSSPLKEFSLDTLLRYFVEGFVVIGLAVLAFPGLNEQWKLDATGIAVASIPVGTIAYPIYRAVFYRAIVNALSKLPWFTRGHRYLTHLMTRLTLSRTEADMVCGQIVRDESPNGTQHHRTHAAEVHLLYMTGITTVVVAVLSAFFGGRHAELLGLLGSAVFGFGACHHKAFRDHRELVLKWIGQDKIDEWLVKHGYIQAQDIAATSSAIFDKRALIATEQASDTSNVHLT